MCADSVRVAKWGLAWHLDALATSTNYSPQHPTHSCLPNSLAGPIKRAGTK